MKNLRNGADIRHLKKASEKNKKKFFLIMRI
jgi:hypothetical protein